MGEDKDKCVRLTRVEFYRIQQVAIPPYMRSSAFLTKINTSKVMHYWKR
jgi:hypothetical protein